MGRFNVERSASSGLDFTVANDVLLREEPDEEEEEEEDDEEGDNDNDDGDGYSE
jgi:hypothetical protein